jgi:hypothetical protein
MHSIDVAKTMDNTQCNCDTNLLWLSYTFKESWLFMVSIINTLLPNKLKKSSIYYYTHCLKTNFCLGHRKMEDALLNVPFLCLFHSTTAPSSLCQPALSRAKITITNISVNRLTRQPNGNTEKYGKKLRGTSEGLILRSLKTLMKVTRWHINAQQFICCHLILISALGILFLEVPYLAFC